MKLYLTLAFATFTRHSFAEPALRGQEQETSSVSSLTSSFSRFGTGLCRDHYGYPYDRATFSGVDTRDACESTCAPLGANGNLVGYEYSDTLNICNCRFTEGYINTSYYGGVGNCPSGAYADWGGYACKVVPPSQGRSGAGRVSQAVGRDSRFECFRNLNFAICEEPSSRHTSLLYGSGYTCPENGAVQVERFGRGCDFVVCETWCHSQGVGCCVWSFTAFRRSSEGAYPEGARCTWRGYANAPVSLVWRDTYHSASLICGEETELGAQNMIK